MQQTQIITYGIDGVLAQQLREISQTRRFWLRETSQLAACQNLLLTSPPSVFVLALGRDLGKELALLEQVHACVPETATIAVGESDHPALAGLAWELGATFALFPPTPLEAITDLVSNLIGMASN